MKLADYLRKHKITQVEFAEKIGARQSSIAEWASGKNIPRYRYLIKIVSATCGEVMPNDFYGEAGP